MAPRRWLRIVLAGLCGTLLPAAGALAFVGFAAPARREVVTAGATSRVELESGGFDGREHRRDGAPAFSRRRKDLPGPHHARSRSGNAVFRLARPRAPHGAGPARAAHGRGRRGNDRLRQRRVHDCRRCRCAPRADKARRGRMAHTRRPRREPPASALPIRFASRALSARSAASRRCRPQPLRSRPVAPLKGSDCAVCPERPHLPASPAIPLPFSRVPTSAPMRE